MATAFPREGIFRILRPSKASDVPAVAYKNPGGHAVRMGMIVILILVQLFFLLEANYNSPLFPGDWSSQVKGYTIFLFLDMFALGLIGFHPLTHPGRPLRIQPYGYPGFAISFVAFAGLAWLLMSAIAYLQHPGTSVAGSIYGDTERLQLFVFYGIFVGPTEELLFRVALPEELGWVIGACVAFPLFHLIAYTTGLTPVSGVNLWVQIFTDGGLGAGLWFLKDRIGYGAAVGFHVGYDLTLVGVISAIASFPLGIAPF
jgi:hypothetical protein